jgi:hypothetical protein
MNSPVSCLRDPIQNMTKGTKKKGTTPRRNTTAPAQKTVTRKQPMRLPYLKQIQAPVSYGMIQAKSKANPMGVITPSGCYVKNFEQVATYPNTGGPAFRVDGAIINPGLTTSFPWLAGMATNYQKFKFHYLRYFYSSAVSTATGGSAYLTLQYDHLDSAPSSLAQVATSDTSSIGPVWFGGAVNQEKAFDTTLNGDANVYIDVDVSRFNTEWFYVRASSAGVSPSSGGSLGGVIPAGLTFSQGSYSDSEAIPGRIYYGTSGVTGANPGYLYASYIVEFIEPVDPSLNI